MYSYIAMWCLATLYLDWIGYGYWTGSFQNTTQDLSNLLACITIVFAAWTTYVFEMS